MTGTPPAVTVSLLGVAIGAVAHAAYHLGAIRQRLAPRDPADVP